MKFSGRMKKVSLVSAIGVFLLFFPYIVGKSEFYLNVFILVGIYLILAMSFQFLHELRLLNLGHPAYMGIGAYISACLTVNFGLPFWVALPIAGIASMVFASLVGIPTVRVGMIAFLMISLSILFLFPVVMANYWTGLFGGYNGLVGVPSPSISLPGLPNILLSHGLPYYYLTLAIVLITVVFFWNLSRSRFGKLSKAIGSAEPTAESVGVNTFKIKMIAFMICTFFAGIAGSLYVHYISVVTPTDFGLQPLILMQVYAIVGGINSVFGPILGAIVVGAVSVFLMDLEIWGELIFGLLLIIVLLLSPDGLWGIGQSMLSRCKGLKKKSEVWNNFRGIQK